MKNFTPFCVTFTLLSPMQTPKHPIMLDGLLYYMIEELHGNNNPQFILGKLDELLDKTEDIYKASSMLMVRNSTQSITAGVATHPSVMKWEDYNYTMPKAPNITTKGGRHRTRMTKYNTISPLALRFYGVGDVANIRFYLQSVFGLGKSVAQGYGQIGEMVLSIVDSDQSWYGDATDALVLHRALPVDVANSLPVDSKQHEVVYRNTRPPYHVNDPVLCLQYPKSLIVVDDDY